MPPPKKMLSPLFFQFFLPHPELTLDPSCPSRAFAPRTRAVYSRRTFRRPGFGTPIRCRNMKDLGVRPHWGGRKSDWDGWGCCEPLARCQTCGIRTSHPSGIQSLKHNKRLLSEALPSGACFRQLDDKLRLLVSPARIDISLNDALAFFAGTVPRAQNQCRRIALRLPQLTGRWCRRHWGRRQTGVRFDSLDLPGVDVANRSLKTYAVTVNFLRFDPVSVSHAASSSIAGVASKTARTSYSTPLVRRSADRQQRDQADLLHTTLDLRWERFCRGA